MAEHDENQVNRKAKEALDSSRGQGKLKQLLLWIAALIIGGILGWINNPGLNELFNFVASVFLLDCSNLLRFRQLHWRLSPLWQHWGRIKTQVVFLLIRLLIRFLLQFARQL